MRQIRSFVSFALIVLIGWGAIYYFFGETKIVVEDTEGKAVAAEVTVNGKSIGTTPITTRLGLGWHSIRIAKPENMKILSVVGEELLTVVRGGSVYSVATRPTYKFSNTAPSDVTDAECWVEDAAGSAVGTCNGSLCEIPLSGPGHYTARYQAKKGDTTLTGSYPFAVNPEQDVYELRWQ